MIFWMMLVAFACAVLGGLVIALWLASQKSRPLAALLASVAVALAIVAPILLSRGSSQEGLGNPKTEVQLDRGEVYKFLHRGVYDGSHYGIAGRVGRRSGPPVFIELGARIAEPCFLVMDNDGDKRFLGIPCPP